MKQLPKKEEHQVSGGAQAPDRNTIDGLVIPNWPAPGPTYPPSPYPNPIDRSVEK